MAKTRTIPLIETRSGPNGTFEAMEDDENPNHDPSLEADQDRSLEDIISEFDKGEEGVSFTARINRVVGSPRDGVKEPYLFSVDSSMISGVRDKLRDEYGSGTYRIRIYKNNKIHRQFDYQIEAPRPGKTTLTGTGDATDRIIHVMQENQRTMREDMNRMIELRSAPVPTSDPMAIAMTMMEKFSIMMKNMMPTPATVGEGTGAVDMLIKGMELAQGMGGNESDSVASIVKEFAKNPAVGTAITGFITQRKQQRPMNGQQQPQRQIPVQDTPPVDHSAKQIGDDLASAVRYLIGKAALGKDPAFYAEWLLEELPPEFVERAISDPNLLDQLTPHFPRLPQYRAWFEELLREANALMMGDGLPMAEGDDGISTATVQADGNSIGGAGDAANLENNGQAGQGGAA